MNMDRKASLLFLGALLIAYSPPAMAAFKPVNHTKGLCLWYGQCEKTALGWQNCYDNTPARSALPGSEVYQLIEELCPWYAKGKDTKVCCDKNMLETLKGSIKPARNFLQRCPSCFTDFMKLFCATTCSPNGATFMDVTSYTWNPTTNAISQVETYMTYDFANIMYDECKNVQSSQQGVPVIGYLCGTSAANCNGEKWLTFMGDPAEGSPTPFKFSYHWENTTAPLPDSGITPFNTSMLHCSDKDPYNQNLTCGCADCPTVCPAPPTHAPDNDPKVLGIRRDSFITLMVIPLWVVLCAIFMTAMCTYYCSRSENDYTLVDETDHEETKKKVLLCLTQVFCVPFLCLDWIGYHFELVLKKAFQFWGLFAAKCWYIVIPCGLIVCIGLSAGLTKFDITTDPVQLWSAPDSRARMDKDYFDQHFGPFYRTEQLIITTNMPYTNYSITTATGQDVSKTIGPVFNMEVLLEVLWLQNNITALKVPFGSGSNATTITLSDICFKPVNDYCTIQSVLQYFQNSQANLEFTRSSPFYGLFGNAQSHMDYCLSNPSSINASDTFKPCLSKFGGPSDPNVVVGGFSDYSPSGTGPEFFNATALIVTFVVSNHLVEAENAKAEAWEKAFLDYVQLLQKNGSLKHINISYIAERSTQDELARESDSDMLTVAFSYLLMFVYVIIFVGGFRSWRTILIDRLPLSGVAGVLMVAMAVTSALGLYGYLGVKGTLIALEVVPFLVLAVGVDNLFIIVHAYERQRKEDPELPLNACLSKALGAVAPSITLTSLSESAAFLLGAISNMPAVRSFSLFAGTAVLLNFLLQISVFFSVLKLDLWLRQACTKAYFRNVKESKHGLLQSLVKQYAKVLLHWSVRPFVMMLFGVASLASIALLLNGFHIGLDQTLAFPKDSYLLNYFDDLADYLHTGPPVYFVVKEGYQYNQREQWNKICTMASCSPSSMGVQISQASQDPNYTFIAEPAANWIDTYLAWVNPSAVCCGYEEQAGGGIELCDIWNTSLTDCHDCLNQTASQTLPKPNEFIEFLPLFKESIPGIECDQGGHAAFGTAIQMLKNDSVIGATYFMTYSKVLRSSDDYVASVKRIQELTKNLTLTLEHDVFAYSVYVVYYEQYLTMAQDTLTNLSFSFAAVAFVTFILMQFSLGSTFVVIVTIAMIIVDMFGLMAILSISLNAISLVNLVMTVGIAVEFCSHIVRWFYRSQQTTKIRRAEDALVHMGTSVISGITITKFLGVFVLLFATSQLFEIFYFRMYMCMIFTGAFHGLVFLPVFLSYLGPTPRWMPKTRSSRSSSVKHTLNGHHPGTDYEKAPATNGLYPTLPPMGDEKSPLLR